MTVDRKCQGSTQPRRLLHIIVSPVVQRCAGTGEKGCIERSPDSGSETVDQMAPPRVERIPFKVIPLERLRVIGKDICTCRKLECSPTQRLGKANFGFEIPAVSADVYELLIIVLPPGGGNRQTYSQDGVLFVISEF